MKTKILILLVTTTLFLGCFEEKDPTIPRELPPATQEGKNTAGCYINDELFVLQPITNKGYPNPFVTLSNDKKQLIISIQDIGKNKEKTIYISLRSEQLINDNFYNLNKVANGIGGEAKYTLIDGKNTTISYITNEDYTGTLEITKIINNGLNRFVAGVFSFQVFNEKTKEVLKITKGRFDLKIK